ncbi:MAG: capsular polysaccharide biosynthesis protein [Thermohalobaculum sp.]|nr:capsular polysaccharide biosynthesis protein [Thermohalobaculum sp.]
MTPARRLHVASPGLLGQDRIARMLALAGWRMVPGLALGPGGVNGVWGRKPWSRPGRLAARLSGAGLLSIEDGFLRSIQPGVTGEAPLSLTLDPVGVYHDARRPSALEGMIEAGAGLDAALLARARSGAARLAALGLSKYSPVPRGTGRLPPPGYVLVVDQTAGDASIRGGGATGASFAAMLAAARVENPGARLVIRSHPDVQAGARRGHFAPADLRPGEVLLRDPVNPWDVIEGAAKVYAVTSQMGFEAALAGREVHLFGLPFYAGWGFTHDRLACPRRTARRTALEVFAVSHLLYPLYYDPFADRLTGFEETVETLARLAARLATRPGGEVFAGFSRWKRPGMLRFRPRHALAPAFEDNPARAAARASAEGRQLWLWASRFEPATVEALRGRGIGVGLVEDGFIRSVGLGASLIDAASLVFDPDGIYYDPARPSRLEALIAEAAAMPPGDPRLARAAALRARIVAAGVTKYNLRGPALSALPPGRRVVLVPGQVEDDASIRRGTGAVRTNLGLLAAARAANPEAFVIYKPHPDVEAGLRQGRVPEAEARRLADHVARHASARGLIGLADEVWTMTSLLGFEALLRGRAVTTLGVPFYAGWGLTRDLGAPPARRQARPVLDALVWAALIAYPAYVDPVSGLPCEAELAVERLAAGVVPRPARRTRWLSRGQDAMAALGLVCWR